MRPSRIIWILALLVSACSIFGPTDPPRTALPPSTPPTPPPAPPSGAAMDAIPDAVPRVEPHSLRGNPASYVVFGKRYFVLATSEGFRERGVASWYGPTFHTRPTSSGEPYDMYAMTAAHKSLPIPAFVRVTNVSNGRSVVVRVNDRGPFVDNRIIDLSYTAAHKLDMTRAGTAFVEIEVLSPGSLSDTARAVSAGQTVPSISPPQLFLQAGAFGIASNAENRAERLRRGGFDAVRVLGPNQDSTFYRVRVGPIADVASFDNHAARLTALGIASVLVTE
jgi:rare lipoprotein A